MIYTVSFKRLDLPYSKDNCGNRIYQKHIIDANDLHKIRQCVLSGLGMTKR